MCSNAIHFLGGLSLNGVGGFMCMASGNGPAFPRLAIVTGVGLIMSGVNVVLFAVGWHVAREKWKFGHKTDVIAFCVTPISISLFCGLVLLLAGVIGSTLVYRMSDICENGMYAIQILITTTGWLVIFFYSLIFATVSTYHLCRKEVFDWFKKKCQ